MTDQPLWTPSGKRKSSSNLWRFMGEVNKAGGLHLESYEDILKYSTDHPESFWSKLWDFCGVKAQTRGQRALVDGDKMPGGRFFPDAKLNYAENLLKRNDSEPALVKKEIELTAWATKWHKRLSYLKDVNKVRTHVRNY